MPGNLPWKEAIIQVLTDAHDPLSPTEIAGFVADGKLRTDLGATPDATVGSVIYTSLKDEGEKSPFVRIGPARFALRNNAQIDKPWFTVGFDAFAKEAQMEASATESDVTGVVNAFGMFWERSRVDWESAQPRLLGKQPKGTIPVDFCAERGVYLLHDSQGVVYVGRATDQNLGRRLSQHLRDRLGGRWTRFSWFGVYPAYEDGKLKTDVDFSHVGIDVVIATMEAVLVEGLEPRQNRKRGDDFQAVEFIQVEDPGLESRKKRKMLDELSAGL